MRCLYSDYIQSSSLMYIQYTLGTTIVSVGLLTTDNTKNMRTDGVRMCNLVGAGEEGGGVG